MLSSDSLEATAASGSERGFCSWRTGWRSVLLREYKDPVTVDDYTTKPTRDQKLVLVTKGSCQIEARRDGAWHGATYWPGRIGLVPPGEAARLRWHGTEHHHTLQLHLSGAMIESVSEELFGPKRNVGPLRHLSLIDPAVATTMLGLEQAARASAPDMHAETAAHFLASHLLLRWTWFDVRPRAASGRPVLERVEDYMRAHLSRPVTLGELADVAGLSRFQLLRLTKRAWGETPQRRLTRLRMEEAQRLLLSKRLTIIEIAIASGYGNPGHFAAAFRRCTGLTPSQFLRNV